MPRVIISDTSCLILLHKIEELELLEKLYKQVLTTPEVAREFGLELPEWIIIESVKDRKYLEFLETQVDNGEASAIALAKEKDSPLVILDDLKGRKLARKLDLKVTGTLGIIQKARQEGLIKKIRPLIEKLLIHEFWIGENIVEELLRKNNE